MVTFFIFCATLIFAAIVLVVKYYKWEAKEIARKEKDARRILDVCQIDLKAGGIKDEEPIVDLPKEEIEGCEDTNIEIRQTRDILDGIDIDLYIKYIAGMQLYSEYGYVSDNVLPTNLNDKDPLLEESAKTVVVHQQGSASLLQRKFSIGYNRAGRLIDQLELVGIVGPARGTLAREVLVADEYSLNQKLSNIKDYSSIDEILDAVEERYYDQIQYRKEYMLKCIEQEKEIERLQKIDEEKELMRAKLLEKERKKQLEREVRQELKDKGLISDD